MKFRLNLQSLSTAYSSFLAWSPLFGIYRLLPGISISETILLIFTLFSIIFRRIKNKLPYSNAEIIFFVFLLYCSASTFFNVLLNETFEIFWLNRIIRFLFYGVCVLITSKVFFEEKAFFKSFNIGATIVFLGILIQYVVYYSTGTYIRLYEFFFPVTNEVLANLDYERIFEYSVFRPSSFFTEPSAVAQYSVIVLIYDFFNNFNVNNKRMLFQVIIICFTILLSKSLWGYFLLLVLFLTYYFLNLKKKHKGIWFIMSPIVIVIASVVFFNSNFFIDTFSRINLFDLGNSAAFTGRFGKYELVDTNNTLSLLFGSGFGIGIADMKAYPNSILFLLMGEGIIGVAILGILYLALMLRKSEVWKRVLCTVFYILMFGSTIIFSLSMIIYYSCLFEKEYN